MSLTPLYSSSAFGVTAPDSLTLYVNLDRSALGPTAPEVVKAVSHLCGFVGQDDTLKPIPDDDYYKVAREYYDSLSRNDPSGKQSLTLLCYVSAYVHELRHVHDLLSTRYGQLVLFKNLNFYQNVPALVAELADWQVRNPNDRIPIPVPPHLTTLTGLRADVLKLIDRYPVLYSDIDALEQPGFGFHGRLTVRNLLECCATNVQVHFINDVFGPEAMERLIQFILDSPAASTYWQINYDLIEAFFVKGFRGGGLGKFINYLAWCALSGSTNGQEDVSIIVLYEALVEHVLHHIELEGAPSFKQITELVDSFCSDWQLRSPQVMISEIRQGLEKQADKMEKAWADMGEASEIGAPLTGAYKKLTSGFAQLNEVIATYPEEYFGNYFWLVKTGLLPSAPLFVMRDGKLLHGLSPGYELLPLDTWNYMAQMATTLKVLLQGRDYDSDFGFLEEESLTNLVDYAPDGVNLKFKLHHT